MSFSKPKNVKDISFHQSFPDKIQCVKCMKHVRPRHMLLHARHGCFRDGTLNDQPCTSSYNKLTHLPPSHFEREKFFIYMQDRRRKRKTKIKVLKDIKDELSNGLYEIEQNMNKSIQRTNETIAHLKEMIRQYQEKTNQMEGSSQKFIGSFTNEIISKELLNLQKTVEASEVQVFIIEKKQKELFEDRDNKNKEIDALKRNMDEENSSLQARLEGAKKLFAIQEKEITCLKNQMDIIAQKFAEVNTEVNKENEIIAKECAKLFLDLKKNIGDLDEELTNYKENNEYESDSRGQIINDLDKKISDLEKDLNNQNESFAKELSFLIVDLRLHTNTLESELNALKMLCDFERDATKHVLNEHSKKLYDLNVNTDEQHETLTKEVSIKFRESWNFCMTLENETKQIRSTFDQVIIDMGKKLEDLKNYATNLNKTLHEEISGFKVESKKEINAVEEEIGKLKQFFIKKIDDTSNILIDLDHKLIGKSEEIKAQNESLDTKLSKTSMEAKKRIDHVDKKVDDLTKKYSSENISSKEKITEIQNKLKELRDLIEEQRESVSNNLGQIMLETSRQFGFLGGSVKDIKNNYAAETNDAKSYIDQFEGELRDLKIYTNDQFDGFKAEVSELKAKGENDLETLNIEMSGIKQNITGLEKGSEKLNQTFMDLEQRFDDRILQTNEELSLLKRNFSSAQETLHHMSEKLNESRKPFEFPIASFIINFMAIIIWTTLFFFWK